MLSIFKCVLLLFSFAIKFIISNGTQPTVVGQNIKINVIPVNNNNKKWENERKLWPRKMGQVTNELWLMTHMKWVFIVFTFISKFFVYCWDGVVCRASLYLIRFACPNCTQFKKCSSISFLFFSCFFLCLANAFFYHFQIFWWKNFISTTIYIYIHQCWTTSMY